jgi:outer membrane lipoprotein-sorting protein
MILTTDPTIASSGEVDTLLNDTIERFQHVSDYTCTLEKKVNKNGKILYDPEIYVKYKKPAKYYFKWEEGRFKGQEVIFAEGENNNHVVAHSSGLFGFITLQLDPEGTIAMRRNHHSLLRSGMEKIFDILEDSYNLHKKAGYGNIEIKGEGNIDGRTTLIVQGDFPEKRGFYARKIIIYLDKELIIPLKVTVYDWSGELFEEYVFHDLKLNVGWDEKDFDPENSEYNFN